MTIKARAAQWLREPLVHFLLIGALVYVVMAGRAPDPGEQRIVVDQAVVSQLVGRWQQTFRRLPTQQETDGLIRDYVKGEVYYREALRLGLDRDDEAVKRLMRNKLVTTLTADAEAARPSDAELQALLDKQPARYAGEPTIAFRQVYLGDDTPAVRALVSKYSAALAGGIDRARLNLPSPLPERFSAAASEIANQFGEGFVPNLLRTTPGSWQGPLRSGLGLHLVFLERIERPPPPKLADVRQRLENDWRSAALAAAEDKRYREMLKGYDVVTKLD
jgi:peptidyl-prolyl cis-trans isomerase C